MSFHCSYADWEINIYLGNFCGELKCMCLWAARTRYTSPKGNFVTFYSRRYAATSKTSSFYGKLSYLNFINPLAREDGK